MEKSEKFLEDQTVKKNRLRAFARTQAKNYLSKLLHIFLTQPLYVAAAA